MPKDSVTSKASVIQKPGSLHFMLYHSLKSEPLDRDSYLCDKKRDSKFFNTNS